MRQIDPEIFASFAAEIAGVLPELTASLEAAPSAADRDAALEPASRHAHNLAGTAELLGQSELAAVCAQLEESLDAARGGERPTDETIAMWQESVAVIGQWMPPPTPTPAAEEPEVIAPELREVFAMEAEVLLRTIHENLARLPSKPKDPATLQEIRRSAHTLKGSAAIVGFRSLAKLAHRMEDVLDELSEGRRTADGPVVELLVRSADALEEMAAGNPTATAELLQKYAELAPAAAEEPTPMAAPEPEEEAEVQPAAAGGQYLRVPLDRLDSVVKLVSELVITRSTLEQRLLEFDRLVNEMRLSTQRLRRGSSKLEVGYEARALAGAGHGTRETHGFDDLEFDRYTDFHLLTRELAEITTDVGSVGQEFNNLQREFEGLLTRQSRLTSEVQDGLMRLRMVPFGTLSSRLSRTVRGTARQLNKPVELVLSGERTELDKTVLEELAEPLLHLMRNAIDHGIESAERRAAAGKPAHGTVRVSAYPDGTQIVLTVADDGGGMDLDRIRATAVERGVITADQAAAMGDKEAMGLVFLPGFSTADAISEVSGRGVGLDIVKTKVHRLEGTVDVDSMPGAGTTFTVRLPLTLAVIRALLVRANEQLFALPMSGVEQILRLEPDAAMKVGDQPVLRVGGKVYPLISLAKALNLPTTGRDETAKPPVVLMRAGGREVGFVVDGLVGGREIVLKSLGSHLRQVPGVAGATLLGDGSVVLVVNPGDLVHGTARREQRTEAARPAARAAGTTVMIVDDSPSVRRVVSALIQSAGWTPLLAKDGLEALELLNRRTQAPDIILMDVEMPRMDGYELLATVRAQPAWRAVPVVMITSRSGDKHRNKAMEMGATAYLAKPYQDETLLRTVRELTRAGR